MANTNLRLDKEKALHVLGVLCLSLFLHRTDAREFKVGGSGSWAEPTDPNAQTYNQWAERNRFQIGDSLLFVYTPEKDSVLLVSQKDYKNCNTTAPIATFNDGHTLFRFNSSGSYHFISGIGENCKKNQKLVVVVMANRTESPSHNGAGSMVVNFMASFGALLGTSLLFVV